MFTKNYPLVEKGMKEEWKGRREEGGKEGRERGREREKRLTTQLQIIS